MILSWKTCHIFVIFLPLIAIGSIETTNSSLNDHIEDITDPDESEYNYDDNYDYNDYYEENPCEIANQCDFYDNEECNLECHHSKFPNETIQDVFSTDKISSCCSSHGYIFQDNCEVNYLVSIVLYLPFKNTTIYGQNKTGQYQTNT